MDDFDAFLDARLDEDEQTAREAGGQWMVLPVSGWIHTKAVPSREWQPPGSDHHVASAPLEGDRAHIVRHDPARVLAEVDAKRRLAELHQAADYEYADGPVCLTCDQGGPLPYPCPTLRLLALPYGPHPDYRDKWRP
ncbi:DUF6221 family protein [Streptomyces sp. NPDC058664]|uniref:DUF6221 family protein n=1 Tax=unclassified Streptomyces TaxID=2593676 RepID=UPI003659B7AC